MDRPRMTHIAKYFRQQQLQLSLLWDFFLFKSAAKCSRQLITHAIYELIPRWSEKQTDIRSGWEWERKSTYTLNCLFISHRPKLSCHVPGFIFQFSRKKKYCLWQTKDCVGLWHFFYCLWINLVFFGAFEIRK